MKTCVAINLVLCVVFCNILQGNVCEDNSEDSLFRSRLSRREQKRNGDTENIDNLKFFKEYNRFDKIEAYIRNLAKLCPSRTKVASIGKTVEGRNLVVIRIGSPSKPAIWIDGGIHAREWISHATVVFIAQMVVSHFRNGSESNENSFIQDFCWYFLPMVNPDGYEYSHTKDRLWRKNRNPNYDKDCIGVDLNRNWTPHWNKYVLNNDACTEIFAGPSPLSEPESRSIANFLLSAKKKQKIVLYLTFHSFGQLWVFPYGHTLKKSPDYKALKNLAEKATKAIQSVNNTSYKTGSTSKIFGLVSGSSADWAKIELGAQYAYSVELPDNGKYGFQMPPENILDIAKETWEGIKAIGEALGKESRRLRKRCRRSDQN